jgi:cell division protease FtsH
MPIQNNKSNNNKSKFNLTWVYVAVLAFVFFFIMTNNEESMMKVNYTKFQECLDSGYVANIKVDKTEQELFFELKPDSIVPAANILPKEAKAKSALVTNFATVDKLDEFVAEKKAEGKFQGEVKYENGGGGFWSVFMQFVFPFLLIILFWMFIMRRMGGGGGGGVFSFGKSKAKLFEGGGNGQDRITFKDVAGLAGAKQEVQEVVDFLRNPQKYTELGGKIPKGILLVGPPGTGKTLLAKAVAGEANVAFFSLSGSDFVEMFVGVGASRVRDLFNQAKAKAPSIVFIDEIDAIGRARSGKSSIQSNDERESTLNQLLTEMDGFGANTGVIVMAATNRADILDKALLRAGRFDRQITVELPDLKERQQIFNVHLKPIKIDESVDVEMLARQTPGLSGADIANVCNEAALIAARRQQDWVDKQCFLDAVDRVLGGLEKKTKVMTESEKRTIAIHEAGHATISWFLQHANPLVKVTIVPRGNALGANWYMPEERPVTTKEELLDQICGLLGGRAAEELFTGHICTGASNDLQRVTNMVYSMISIYGMGEKMPNVNYYDFAENTFTKPYSEATAQMIDEEVKTLIQREYDRAKRVLIQHSRGLQQLAQVLIEKEVIYPADLERIFGPRQWKSRSDEIMELNKNLGANGQDGTDESTDFDDENAEFIRQKAVEAVLEKQRRLQEQNALNQEAGNGNASQGMTGAAGAAGAAGMAGATGYTPDSDYSQTYQPSAEQDNKQSGGTSDDNDYNPIFDSWSSSSSSAYSEETETSRDELTSEPVEENEPEPLVPASSDKVGAELAVDENAGEEVSEAPADHIDEDDEPVIDLNDDEEEQVVIEEDEPAHGESEPADNSDEGQPAEEQKPQDSDVPAGKNVSKETASVKHSAFEPTLFADELDDNGYDSAEPEEEPIADSDSLPDTEDSSAEHSAEPEPPQDPEEEEGEYVMVNEGRKKDIDFVEVVPADERAGEDKGNKKDDEDEPELTITLDE